MGRKPINRITGTQQEEVKETIMQPAACPVCKSMRRAPFVNTTQIESSGITPAGQPYNLVVWRRTNCLDCGQYYVVKSFENLPAQAQPDSEPESEARVTPQSEGIEAATQADESATEATDDNTDIG